MVALQYLIITIGCLFACGLNTNGKSLKITENNLADCQGLVRLISPDGVTQEFRESKKQIKSKATKAVLEGCGCFRLFERKHQRGRSFYVNKIGEQEVPLARVRSLARVNCSNEGFPSGSFVRIDFDHKMKKDPRTRSHRSVSAMFRHKENLTLKDDGHKALRERLAQLQATIRTHKQRLNVLRNVRNLYSGHKYKGK